MRSSRRARVYGMIEQNHIYMTRQGEVFHFSRFSPAYGSVDHDWYRNLCRQQPSLGRIASMQDNTARVLRPCRY